MIPGPPTERARSLATQSLLAGCALAFLFASHPCLGRDLEARFAPLVGEDSASREAVLEALLSPGEFPSTRFVHMSEGGEALFSLDSSLSAASPYAELHPERLRWPKVAGLELAVANGPLKLVPTSPAVTEDSLEGGFVVRWILAPRGQQFAPAPHFEVEVVEAEVLTRAGGRRLLAWKAPPAPDICRRDEEGGLRCELAGVGREARALALSPDGALLALALGGLKPRLEVYDVRGTPRLSWQALLPKDSGGAAVAAFSADGRWVVALTGRGALHRFAAASGGSHLAIASAGRTARAVPPGNVMAVAGEGGAVTLWLLDSGTVAWRLPPRQLRGPVDRLAASGDGRRLATLEYGAESTVVRVWEVRSRAMLAEIKVDAYAVVDLALDEAGETLFITHETKGLFAAAVARRSAPEPLPGPDAARCRGRLEWIAGEDELGCAVSGGEIRLDRQGRRRAERVAAGVTGDWIVAASPGGSGTAAVGGGRLVVWRPAARSKEP